MAGFKRRAASPETLSHMQKAAVALSAPADAPPPSPLSDSHVQQIADGTFEVPVARVRPNPENPRHFRASSAVDTIAASIREKGQQVPCPAFIDGDFYTLIDGGTRLEAIRSIDFPTIRIEIRPRPSSQLELYLLASSMNTDRHAETALDKALAWTDKLKRKLINDPNELPSLVGMSKGNVSKILAIAEIPRSALTIISEYPDLLSLRFLYSLYQYWSEVRDEEEVVKLVLDAQKNGLGAADIDDRRKRLAATPRQKPRAIKTPFDYAGKKGEIARFDTKGRIELTITGLEPAAMEQLERDLVAVVKGEPFLQSSSS